MNNKKPLRVVMLDLDGVIRVPSSGLVLTPDHFDFCPERINSLAKVCRELNLKIVISSDWRNFGEREYIESLIPQLATYFHDDWMTPVLGHRYQEVGFWLMKHEPDNYVILEDLVDTHFGDAGQEMKNRIVECKTNEGLTSDRINMIYRLFGDV